MQKLFRVPLLFLFVASFIGLFLRYQLISPIEGIQYSYLLHAHSHVMFLGWVFNVLVLAFMSEFQEVTGFKRLFWFFQLCVAGMLVSFPLQGYGAVSITFSTLHTFGALAFITMFFTTNRKKSSLSLTSAKASLLFFALASIGPFLLGYLKANDLDHTNLYRYSIYFYLHFQYNGFFLFGVLSLFTKTIEHLLSAKESRNLSIASYILIGACVPAYFLSVLWSDPGIAFNIIGLVSGVAQVIGLALLIQPATKFISHQHFTPQQKLLFSLSFAALVLKSILQLLSAHPLTAMLANEYRSILIAYLHLVLVGCISFFLIGWLMWKGIVESKRYWASSMLVLGFIGSEALLIATPWTDYYLQLSPVTMNNVILFFSVMMVAGIGLFMGSSFMRKSA